jgi:hypothetical protein
MINPARNQRVARWCTFIEHVHRSDVNHIINLATLIIIYDVPMKHFSVSKKLGEAAQIMIKLKMKKLLLLGGSKL